MQIFTVESLCITLYIYLQTETTEALYPQLLNLDCSENFICVVTPLQDIRKRNLWEKTAGNYSVLIDLIKLTAICCGKCCLLKLCFMYVKNV
jgi:hypothetical protein